MATPEELEDCFEKELAADDRLRRSFDIGSWVMSLGAVATFLVLIIPMGRNSPFLIFLSLYSPVTRLLSMVSWKAFLFPHFALKLDDPDPAVAAAARAVLERHRSEIVEPVLRDYMLRSTPEAVAAFDPLELARMAREHGIERRRRLGRRVFVGWIVVSVMLWTTLVVTRGGPGGAVGVVLGR